MAQETDLGASRMKNAARYLFMTTILAAIGGFYFYGFFSEIPAIHEKLKKAADASTVILAIITLIALWVAWEHAQHISKATDEQAKAATALAASAKFQGTNLLREYTSHPWMVKGLKALGRISHQYKVLTENQPHPTSASSLPLYFAEHAKRAFDGDEIGDINVRDMQNIIQFLHGIETIALAARLRQIELDIVLFSIGPIIEETRLICSEFIKETYQSSAGPFKQLAQTLWLFEQLDIFYKRPRMLPD